MPKKSQSQTGTLGRSIIRSRFKGQTRPKDSDTKPVLLHTDDSMLQTMQSITEENDLDSFLRTAEMAGTEFIAERLNMRLIPENMPANYDPEKMAAASAGDQNRILNGGSGYPFLLSAAEELEMQKRMNDNRHLLKVPRRPKWNRSMTAQELNISESSSFLEWRRSLAYVEEEMEMILTPFERNLEVWRQLWRVIERSDVLVQIVDGRNPLFFRCKDLETYVSEAGSILKENLESESESADNEDAKSNVSVEYSEKKNVLLINKADYLSQRQRQEWARFFKEQSLECIFFSAATDDDDNDAADDSETPFPKAEIENAGVLGQSQLITYFESLCPAQSDHVTIGLVGYPNVGKSSTINKLMKEKRVTVSSTPGKTKHFQTMNLTDKITLCDCPGLVFPSFATTKAEMVVNGVLSIDQLREFTGPSQLVASRIPKWYLEWYYGIQMPKPKEGENPRRTPTATELLSTYALARGFRKAGQGNPDESRAARNILKEYVSGKLVYCHAPPDMSEQDQAEFSMDAYVEGGHKYDEYIRESSTSSKHYADAQLYAIGESIETVELSDIPLTLEEQKQQDGKVRVKTAGYKSTEFVRVQSFPYQSGYEQDKEELVGMDKKKAHKFGKKRIKDRSWRV